MQPQTVEQTLKQDFEQRGDHYQNNANNIVRLPNGVVMLKNSDPNIPPTLIMPPDNKAHDDSSEASDTDDIMDEYQDGLMQLKMMQAMQKQTRNDTLDNFV